MFGNNNKLAALEARVFKLEQANRCAKGEHEWRMELPYRMGEPPYIRCPHCYAFPQEKKS